MVPDTQAALRGITNSNPSPDSRVTYSEGDEDITIKLIYNQQLITRGFLELAVGTLRRK
jgi:hypothetical protein